VQVPRGKVQSANVEAAVPTELQTLLNCFTMTGCFRQCLPPAVRICHYKNAVLCGSTKRTETHAYIQVLRRVRKIAKSNY